MRCKKCVAKEGSDLCDECTKTATVSDSPGLPGYVASCGLKASFRECFTDEYLDHLQKKATNNDIKELLFMAFCHGHNAETLQCNRWKTFHLLRYQRRKVELPGHLYE